MGSFGACSQTACHFWAFAGGWIEAAKTASLPNLFDRILLDLEYQEYLSEGSEEEVIDRWANVQELRRITFEFEDLGISAFLENLALVSDQDTLPEKTEAPTLLTLHAAKGLEFDHVFIIGLEDGMLPHSRAFEDEEEMAEERRLFYVGITRARDILYLLLAERRSAYGTYENQLPSRFLRDIPTRLVSEDFSSQYSSFGYTGRQHQTTRNWTMMTKNPIFMIGPTRAISTQKKALPGKAYRQNQTAAILDLLLSFQKNQIRRRVLKKLKQPTMPVCMYGIEHSGKE